MHTRYQTPPDWTPEEEEALEELLKKQPPPAEADSEGGEHD